jgi:hypothetical protein
METPMDEPLFKSAPDALAFAFHYTMQQYDRPLVNRLADGPGVRTGRGLSGTDGAATAGSIRRHVGELLPLDQAALVARFAPEQTICGCGRSCCAGKIPNHEWQAGLRVLADYAEREALKNCSINRNLTLRVLRKLMGQAATTLEIASRAGVSENTAAAHLGRLKVWYRGESVGKGDEPPKEGVEQLAMMRIEESLRLAGLVGYISPAE